VSTAALAAAVSAVVDDSTKRKKSADKMKVDAKLPSVARPPLSELLVMDAACFSTALPARYIYFPLTRFGMYFASEHFSSTIYNTMFFYCNGDSVRLLRKSDVVIQQTDS